MEWLLLLGTFIFVAIVWDDEPTAKSDYSNTPEREHKGNSDYLFDIHKRNEEIERRKAEARGETYNGW